jgi:hypothetical protein
VSTPRSGKTLFAVSAAGAAGRADHVVPPSTLRQTFVAPVVAAPA